MSNGRTKLLLALLLLLVIHATTSQPIKTLHVHTVSHLEAAATGHCDGTLYPDLCASTLSAIPNVTFKSLPEIIASTVNHTITAVHSAGENCTAFRRLRRRLDPRQMLALGDCIELLGTTVDQLRRAVSDLSGSPSTHLADLSTVLSAAMTNQYTCLDGFAYVEDGGIRPRIEHRFRRISRLISNSLAMSKKIRKKYARSKGLLEGYDKTMKSKFPAWLSVGDRRLLQATTNTTKANLVVAKDGTGNFTTIGEALAATPNNSASRFVIYIKAGAYFENVEVVNKQTNIMFFGDGIGKTVIKASRNVVDGWTTFRSATVAAVGNGFLARDITIENSAGPSKHQAVALRTGSDLSAFYRCSFVGYQDTLYVHTLRQFYRECDIYGTVDFIFGDAAVVFQNCNMYARKPDPNQKNIVTAQGRQDPNQNTGISIQNCKIAAAADLIPVQKTFPTYLGRPWKQYSRTVYLQSNIEGHIDPAGWLEWDGDFALSTLFYGEYKNIGAGSNTTNRVKWPGYRVITNITVANQFTVSSFVQGDQWLGASMFPFLSGLS